MHVCQIVHLVCMKFCHVMVCVCIHVRALMFGIVCVCMFVWCVFVYVCGVYV